MVLPLFEKIKCADGTLTIHEVFAKSPLSHLFVQGWEALSNFPGFQIVRSTSNSMVGKLAVPGNHNEHFLYVKRYLRRNWKDALKELVRSSRAMRAFQGALVLIDHNLPTAPLVAVFDGEGDNSFLVTEEISNALTVYQLLEKLSNKPKTAEVLIKRRIFTKLAELLGKMHRIGVYHHDLRAGNILIDSNKEKLYFIDTDRVTFERPLQIEYIVKNLAQLNMILIPQLTVTDRVRFFKAYCGFAEIPETMVRTIFSKSEARSRAKLLQALPKHLHRTASTLPFSELVKFAYRQLYHKSQ